MLDSGKNKIWRGLVDYVNAPDLESSSEALDNLALTLSECMPWMARTEYLSDVPLMIALRTNRKAVTGENEFYLGDRSEEQLTNQFRQQAIEYQPQVRQLLTWLFDRKRNWKDEGGRIVPFAFLYRHTVHIEFAHGVPTYAPEEEKLRYFTSSGDLKDVFPFRTLSYKDVADVICDFIQQEHELGKDVPIRICKRPGCGNLVAQLKKRKYCRTALCDHERQKRDDDLKQKKNRDNVFLCRLRKMPPAMRRKKARESADRLRQIESDWRDRNQSLAKHALKLLNEG